MSEPMSQREFANFCKQNIKDEINFVLFVQN